MAGLGLEEGDGEMGGGGGGKEPVRKLEGVMGSKPAYLSDPDYGKPRDAVERRKKKALMNAKLARMSEEQQAAFHKKKAIKKVRRIHTRALEGHEREAHGL